jgi:cytochrome c5
MTEEHSSPIKTPKQLVIVVLLAFIVPIAVAVMISQLVTSGEHGTGENENIVLSRIQPVGTVVIAEPSAPKGTQSGEQVYGTVCKTCHDAGLAGAPKFGDKAAWAKVIAQGDKLSFEHAINGFKAMPPRGGNSDLTDDEVKRAVAFMVNKAGANWSAPAVTATAAAPAPSTTPAAAAAAPATAAPATPPAASASTTVASAAPAAAGPADGKKTYEATCVVCHGAGIAGAPKLGDKAAWAPRIKTGMDAMLNAALHGKGAMPPKGGNTTLSDADVKAAVSYMVAAVK